MIDGKCGTMRRTWSRWCLVSRVTSFCDLKEGAHTTPAFTDDFFIGMGDINAAFVSPRATDLAPEAVLPTAETTVLEIESATPEEALAFKQAQDLENQLEQRPLKRLQEELEAAEATSERSTDEVEDGSKKSERSTTPDDSTSTGRTEDSARTEPKAVLKVNDDELRRVEMVSFEIYGHLSLGC